MWYMSLYVGDHLVCRLCIPDGHLHIVTYTRYRINTFDSSHDEHKGARNMKRTGTNIYEKRIVRQVGYLQELDSKNLKCKY